MCSVFAMLSCACFSPLHVTHDTSQRHRSSKSICFTVCMTPLYWYWTHVPLIPSVSPSDNCCNCSNHVLSKGKYVCLQRPVFWQGSVLMAACGICLAEICCMWVVIFLYSLHLSMQWGFCVLLRSYGAQHHTFQFSFLSFEHSLAWVQISFACCGLGNCRLRGRVFVGLSLEKGRSSAGM